MAKKIIICILVLSLAALIAGAGLVYKDLRDEIQAEQLAALAEKATKPSESVTGDPTEEDTEPQKTAAPNFTVVDLEGNVYQLTDFLGKPVVLNFWASWCGPCKSEMPHFEEKAAEYGDEVHFLMVNLTDGETETLDTASAFVRSGGYTFPVYYDTAMNAAAAYGVSAIPVTYFIDAEGYLAAYASGAVDGDVLQKGIDMASE